jgi:hypothetical protein
MHACSVHGLACGGLKTGANDVAVRVVHACTFCAHASMDRQARDGRTRAARKQPKEGGSCTCGLALGPWYGAPP